MRVLAAANGKVLNLAFSPDGQALAAAVEEHGVFLWNLRSTGVPVQLDDAGGYRSRTLAFGADGRTVGWVAGNTWKVYDRDSATRRRVVMTFSDGRRETYSLAHIERLQDLAR